MKNTKFIIGMYSLTILLLSALVGKFTGELATAVVGICGIFCGANAWNTTKALKAGAADA